MGLFLGIGLAVFTGWQCLPNQPHERHGAKRLLSAAALATVLGVGLLGVDALGEPLSALFSAQAWRVGALTSAGSSALLCLAAIGLAAGSLRMHRSAARRVTSAAALIVLAVAMATSGHASAAPPAWLARPAVALHAIAVCLWIGSLFPLSLALRGSPSDADDIGAATLSRFSRIIPCVLAGLFASGAVLIYLQFDTPGSLWRTSYGWVLIAKLLLLAGLLALAAWNRYRLTTGVLRAEAMPRHTMRRVIRAELVVAIAILAVVALWRFTPPPRASGVTASTVEHVATRIEARTGARIEGASAIAALSWVSATGAAAGELTVVLTRRDRSPLEAQEVDVAFSNEAVGIEPIVFPAERRPDGVWRVHGFALPQQASWHIRVDVLVSDFERVRLQGVSD